MKSLATKSASPVLDWDKKVVGAKSSKKKSNPVILGLGLILLVLLGSAIFRASHDKPVEPMVQVVTSIRDLPAGARLGLMSLKLISVPKRFVTPDMVTSLTYASGSVARTYIAPGEPIIHTQLFAKDASLAMALETHERAMTLQLTDDALIDHYLNPDDRVDVICVSSNKDGKKFTRTIAVDARVLMCVQKNQLLARRLGNSSANMVTLALTPDIVEAVNEAVEVGKIRLVLRNRLTRIEPTLKGVSPDDLLPASAMSKDEKPTLASTAVGQGEKIPAPPAVVDAPPALPESPESPVKWIVEMFAGNHKEYLGVSAQ